MSRGKHLSLEEARKQKKLKRFAEEHPSTGDKDAFDHVLDALAKTAPKGGQTSGGAGSED